MSNVLIRAKHYIITNYWLSYYVNDLVGLCSLCGNKGKIDTRGVKSPAGIEAGRINFCICPNGQHMRKASQ